MHRYVAGLCRQLEQRAIQISTPQSAPQGGNSVHIWETAFGNTLAKVPANSAKWRACAGVQSNPLERCNTCRHQTLAARFFSGKTPTFKQLDGKANSSELDRRCRTCQTSASDENIDHWMQDLFMREVNQSLRIELTIHR
jgi:hypothetical protein